jgi:hypothetical protein
MTAIKKARKYMAANPTTESTQTLTRLILALEADEAFALRDLYKLDYNTFLLALDVMKDWRLDRYYTGKGMLLDVTLQLTEAKH